MNPYLAKRKELGLTQAQVARLLGTKQSNVSAYERGVLEPGSVVESRFAALLDVHADSVFRAEGFPTLASQVAELRKFLSVPTCTTTDDQDGIILRVLIDSNDRFQELENKADQEFFVSQPGSVGLHRADVAFAGMAVHWARTAHLPRVPSWTRNPDLYLQQPWFVDGGGEGNLLGVFGLARGVPALRSRGVFLMETNLESI